jgi:hypothetical protein
VATFPLHHAPAPPPHAPPSTTLRLINKAMLPWRVVEERRTEAEFAGKIQSFWQRPKLPPAAFCRHVSQNHTILLKAASQLAGHAQRIRRRPFTRDKEQLR